MNTSSLLRAMDGLFSRSRLNVNYYVTAADTVYSTVDFTKYPIAIICNTDVEKGAGKHWIAFWLPEKGVMEYFDSFALPIYRYWNVEVPPGAITKENCIIYQSALSNVCGNHCLFFLYNRALGVTYHDFVNNNYNFSVRHNDALVRRFVSQIPGLEPCRDYPCTNKIQTCKCRIACSEFM